LIIGTKIYNTGSLKQKWPKAMLAEMNAKMDANQATGDTKQEKMLARMREDIKSGQAEMRSIVCAFRSELRRQSNMK
jgi:hypothetical protein